MIGRCKALGRPELTKVRHALTHEKEIAMHFQGMFRVKPDSKLRLNHLDPAYKGEHESAETAGQETEHFREKLAHQQALLYAQRKHSVLVVLQAKDAGGKDGTVNHVFSALNPQGTTVVGFKQPTPIELAHDFLWRVYPHTPGRGEVVIFNRSHYEDVLVTRVHKLIDKATWIARYKRIREFEAGLTDNGTTILNSSCISAKKNSSHALPSGWRIQSGTGRSASPTIPSARCGTTTSRRSRMRSAPPAPARRHGT